MSRKELTAAIFTIAAILLPTGAAMLPNSFKEQYPWIWQVLVGAGVLSLIIALVILIPTKVWKAIVNFFPFRIIREIILQIVKPSRFLHIQKPEFEFLHMSGGKNSRTWSSEFNIISCLFHDLRADRIDIRIAYPIMETWIVQGDFLLAHFGITKIKSGRANMSDTSFHYLEEQSKSLKQKGKIDIRCDVIGFRNNRELFSIIDGCYDGELNEWGQNNA